MPARVEGDITYADINVGGYVQRLTIHTSADRLQLRVSVLFESLDSKPSATYEYVFRGGHFRPQPRAASNLTQTPTNISPVLNYLLAAPATP